MYFFRSNDDSPKPRCRVDRAAPPPRHLLVTIIGLFGFLWLGAYPLCNVLYAAFSVGPWTDALHAGLALAFCLLSYHLLRLREWARQLLLVLNGLCLCCLWLYEFGMFVVLPWIINRSSSERILTLTSIQQKLSERTPSCGPIELVVLHVYLLGSVILLYRHHTRQMFWTHQEAEATPCPLRVKLALVLVGLICAGQLTHAVTSNLPLLRRSAMALKIHAIPLEASPREDALACALFVVQQAQTTDSLQRVGLLDSLAKAFSEKGAVNQVVHIAEAVVNATQASRLTRAAVSCMKTDKAKADALLARAYALARKDPVPESRDRQLASVAWGCYQLGDRTQAMEIVEVMTSPDQRARALCDMGASDLRNQEPERGIELLDRALSEALQAKHLKNREDVLIELVQLYLKERVQKAERVIDLIESASAKALALCESAIAKRSGAPEASQRILSQARLAAALSAHPDETLIKMVAKLAQADLVEEAIRMAETVYGPFQRAESLNQIAGHLAQTGQRERGISLLNEIASTLDASASETDDNTGFVTLLTQVATHYASLGRKATAFDILDKLIGIVQAGPASSRQDVLLSVIAKQYAQIGGLAKAYGLIETIGQPEIRMHALVHLLIEADQPHVPQRTRAFLLNEIVAKYARL